MALKIDKAAVIGAGPIGSDIAALLASIRVKTLLLDQLPSAETTPDEEGKGSTRSLEAWRNSRAMAGFQGAVARGSFTDAAARNRITLGNTQDHAHLIGEADWVIEAVGENPDSKRSTLQLAHRHAKATAFVTSQSAGIRAAQLMEGADPDLARRFFVAHFFSPVPRTRLVEIVPSLQTDRRLIEPFSDFCAQTLGKQTIVVRDTPYYLANRLGLFTLLSAMRHGAALSLRVPEVDLLSGQIIGRAKSGTYGSADLVGLDQLLAAFDQLHAQLPDDPFRDRFGVPGFFREMVVMGRLGRHSGSGFYRTRPGSDEPFVEAVSLDSFLYGPATGRLFPSVLNAQLQSGLTERVRALISGRDEGSAFVWNLLKDTFLYAAHLLGRIADEPLQIDRAMRWGYSFSRGPFELWDDLGFEEIARRIKEESGSLPESAEALLSSPNPRWYDRSKGYRTQFHPIKTTHLPTPVKAGSLSLNDRTPKWTHGPFALYDAGEEVAAFSFTQQRFGQPVLIDPEFLEALQRALDETPKLGFRGLILHSSTDDFSPGFNLDYLHRLCTERNFKALEGFARDRRKINLAVKSSPFPVVAALSGKVLGPALELALHCSLIQVHGEARLGFVEPWLGLIPSGGGCREMLYRAVEMVTTDGPHPMARYAFDAIMPVRVRRGTFESQQSGFIRRGDRVTMGRDRLLFDARALVVRLVEGGYAPRFLPPPALPGPGGAAVLRLLLFELFSRGQIGPHDREVGSALARVVTGGTTAPFQSVSDESILELELDAFLSLCGMPKTHERIEHYRRTGEPLLN